jgi:maltodextrin utilization protein YvdJ
MSVHFKHCSESATTVTKECKVQRHKIGILKSVATAKEISLAKKSQELDKMSKEKSTTSITGLNLLLYKACIRMRILLVDKIRFLLGDMCKVTENHHDSRDGSAPTGSGISSK